MKLKVIDDDGKAVCSVDLSSDGKNEKGEYYDFKVGIQSINFHVKGIDLDAEGEDEDE